MAAQAAKLLSEPGLGRSGGQHGGMAAQLSAESGAIRITSWWFWLHMATMLSPHPVIGLLTFAVYLGRRARVMLVLM